MITFPQLAQTGKRTSQWFPFRMLHPQVWYSPGNNIRAFTVFAIYQLFAQLQDIPVSICISTVFFPDFHGCINSALVAADSIDLFSE